MWELLDASAWVTRNNCGWFPSWLVALYVLSNVGIWLAYESIPLTIRKLAQRGIAIFTPQQSQQFIAFIHFCGRGHLLENVLVFFWPNYLAFALWHLATAIVSIRTAASLRQLRHRVLSDDEWQQVEQLTKGVADLDEHSEAVHEELTRLKVLARHIETMNGESDR